MLDTLRKFDNETIVILSTGFANEKPPAETMNQLSIQGYFDKSRDTEDLVVLVKGAINTSNLVKENFTLNYKDDFIGKFLVNVTDALKSYIMCISMNNNQLDEIVKELSAKEYIESTKEQLGKMNNLTSALDFRNDNVRDVKKAFETVKILTHVYTILQNATLTFTEVEYSLINCKSSSIIYVLIEVILYLCNAGIKDIKITNIKADNNKIVIENSYQYDDKFIKKINNIVADDENVKVVKNNDLLEIYV